MSWSAPWISAFPGWVNTGRVAARDLPAHVRPAPYLRRRFFLEEEPASPCRLQLVSAGWHELYVNGEKADERILSPCVSQFNVHVNGVEYDLTGRLHRGWNALTVLLGNGLFNPDTSEVWNFLHASWRDFPRMSCVLTLGDTVVLRSDASWRFHESPLVYNSFRSGECYDFSREIPGVLQADFQDGNWEKAHVVRPPAGTVRWEEMEPCRIVRRLSPVELRLLKDGEWMADMGTNLTGWAQVELEFPEALAEPREVRMLFGERLNPEDGTADRKNVEMFILEGCPQQESRAILCPGRRRFSWRQHFTYFGYRYLHIQGEGLQEAKVKVEGLFIHNDFPQAGEWTSSSPALNRLQQVILQSYLSNFTGIPTDCPHREKNGWSGDCSLAMETGLWNFHAQKAYKEFLQVFVDGQRPSGELPPIAPVADWYWNCGPGWDAFLFVASWNLLLYCGDDAPARKYYEAMKRYLAFSEQMEVEGLVEYGLGDWCAPVRENMPAIRLTSSAWICDCLAKFAFFSRRFGEEEEARKAEARRERMKAALRREYLQEDGRVEKDWPSSLACFLYFGLCQDAQEEARLAERLVQKIRGEGHRVSFGIFGAKWIPRVLADHGYGADALELFLQPHFPGYQDTLTRGATTLWETWTGSDSLQHIMFGDPSAWAYQYLGGLRPRIAQPGFAGVDLAPQFVPQLTSFQCRHRLPDGRELKASWQREGERALYRVHLPQGVQGTLHLPGQAPQEIPAGDSQYPVKLPFR